MFRVWALILTLVTLAGALAAGGSSPHSALAAGITVNTTVDELNADGDCSLREAVRAANTNLAVDTCTAGSGADTITVPAGTYALTIAGAGEDAAATGDLDVTGGLTINGAGAGATIIDAGDLDRVLHVMGVFTVSISGVTIRNGSQPEGAGIYNAGGALTLSNVSILDNIASFQGGGILNQTLVTSSLTLNSSTVSNNAGQYGGGISSGGGVTLNGSAVSGNTASIEGGGIYNYLSTVTLNALSTISNNFASSHGGGMYNNGGTATLNNSTFSGNQSVGGGGGGIVNGGTATLTGSTVSGNTAVFGGGIWNPAGSSLTLTGGTVISGNTAGNGGGIDNNSGLTITASSVTANTANSGGGIYNNGGTATLTSSSVSGNVASGNGGGIFSNGPLTLSSSTVGENTAVGGGGIYNNGGTTVLTASNVSANVISGTGGGIHSNGGTTTLTGSSVSGNISSSAGGGIYTWGAVLTISNSTVGGNTSAGNGGGIFNAATTELTRTTVSNNTSTGYGGGIYNGNGYALIINSSTVSGNSGYGGGGIYNIDVPTTLTINSSTLSNNSATPGQGGGIYNVVSATLFNTVVANSPSGGNCAGSATRVTSGGYNLSSDATCLLSWLGDMNSTNPLLGPLAMNGGPTRTHALLDGSPAAETGAFACPTPDQRGVTRPQGLRCDIGAYEAPDTDLDGAPDPLDLDDDDDTVPDALDSCPLVMEDLDGFQDGDGCPDSDNDGDGVCDTGQVSVSCTGSDSGKQVWDPAGTLAAPVIDCRNIAEDQDGFKDSDGCPEPDNDNDGFPDYADNCPGTGQLAGVDGMLGASQDANHNGIQDGLEPAFTSDDAQLTFEDYDTVLDGDGCHDSPGDDFDGDGLTDDSEVFTHLTLPYNPDTDADTVLDGTDNCPNWANAGQALPTWTIPALDSDCDGFTLAREQWTGTNPTKHCNNTNTSNDEPTDAWPTDFNDSRLTSLADVVLMGPVYNQSTGTDPAKKRFDLNASGLVSLADVVLMGPFYNKSCA